MGGKKLNKHVGVGVNSGPAVSSRLLKGLVCGLLESEPVAILVAEEQRKGYNVTETKTRGISPNVLFIVADVTLLPRTRAVYKLMKFFMENIQPPRPPHQQSHHHCCCMCYRVHAHLFHIKMLLPTLGSI